MFYKHYTKWDRAEDYKGIKIDNFKILRKCRSKADTPIFEAILIRKFNPSLNRQLVKPGWQHSHKLKVFT